MELHTQPSSAYQAILVLLPTLSSSEKRVLLSKLFNEVILSDHQGDIPVELNCTFPNHPRGCCLMEMTVETVDTHGQGGQKIPVVPTWSKSHPDNKHDAQTLTHPM